jgi:hypothetical protein
MPFPRAVVDESPAIRIPRTKPLPSESDIEAAIAKLGLLTTLRATLASFPGSIHWHLKRDRQRGTLELTLWPAEHRLWLSVQGARNASWIGPGMRQLKAALEQTRD